MAEFFTGSDVGKSGLQVKKTTGTPDVRGVTEIQLDSNLTLTNNGGGSVTVQSTGGGSGSGTVTSVGLTETGSALTITGSPVTTSGTINIAGAGAATDVILGDLTLGTFTDGTVTSVALTETGSALTITGSPITSSGTINIEGAGNSGQVILGDLSLGTLTSGTVTEVSTSLTGISIANPTTTPAISGTLAVASGGTGANTLTDGGILLGSGTGIITATSQPATGELLIGVAGSDPVLANLTAGTGVAIDDTTTPGAIEISATGTGGTVTSVGLTETGSALTITGSPVTGAGTINIAGAGTSSQVVLGDLSLGTLTSGTVTNVSTTLSGISITNPTTTPAISGTLDVASGGTGANTLTDGGILIGDGTGAITATTQPINGQLLIGSTGSDPVLSTLTAGTGVSISNTAGAIEISATGSGGTVTSVGLTGGSALTITGSPVTSSGTINIAGAGTSSQVILGDLTLGTLPSGADEKVKINAADATAGYLQDKLLAGTGITSTLNLDPLLGTQIILDNDSLAFKTIAVSGQNNVVADALDDTLTLAAGANMTITTNDATDTITFASTGGGGSSGVDVENSGVALGTATTLNFSTNLAASLAGSTATITASGSGGGGNQPVYVAHDGSASPYWGDNIRFLQTRIVGGEDMANINDFSYFTPLFNEQGNGGSGEFQMSGDNGTLGSRNLTAINLPVGAEFILGTGIELDNEVYPTMRYSFDEYNGNVGATGATQTKQAFWILNLNFTGKDGSTLGNLIPGTDIFTNVDLRNLRPPDIVKYFITAQHITVVYAGEYTLPKSGQTVDLFLIKEQGIILSKIPTPLIFDLTV